jgi:hypothetical protein
MTTGGWDGSLTKEKISDQVTIDLGHTVTIQNGNVIIPKVGSIPQKN